MMRDDSRSATASIASSRRRMRSVRQSLASSTAERSRLPWCFSSLASKRSKSVKASAVAPANPARMRSWYRRRTLRAVALTTMLPRVTWPSPPMATRSPRRTERMVVPWNCGESGFKGSNSNLRALANLNSVNWSLTPIYSSEIAFSRRGISGRLASHENGVPVDPERLEKRRVELGKVREDHALAGELDRLDGVEKRGREPEIDAQHLGHVDDHLLPAGGV